MKKGYRYIIRTNSEEAPIERADWADIDQWGRLVFSRGGKLFACDATENDIDKATELADFSDSKFEPLAPPEWAKVW